MTIYDYLMVMKKVKIAYLKARLSEHLRQVRRGETFTVMDRETPIARLVPYGAEDGPRGCCQRPRGGRVSSDARSPPSARCDHGPGPVDPPGSRLPAARGDRA